MFSSHLASPRRLLTVPQKSKEKNTGLEEQHRRNEISMRRKQQQQVASPTATSDDGAPKSPASTGAMDDLLQKLRAAKPEARDQRDRRRRARLKDRHQVRVASGQQIPEIGVNVDDDAADPNGNPGEPSADKTNLLSPTSETNESEASIATSLVSPTAPGVDVADRAAAMLEGLQRPDSLNKDGSLSVRRRRESADTERERRRRRRQQATSKASDDGGLMSPSIPEEREGVEGSEAGSVAGGSVAGDRPGTRDGRGGDDGGDDRPITRGSDDLPPTPTTVVVPPSPEQKGRELPTPPPDE